jgi:predicted transcriptional regulator of viral defense system
MDVLLAQTDKVSEALGRRQEAGRYTLTAKDMQEIVHATPAALTKAAQRLVRKGRLYMPRRGFYVIVPAEYCSSH